MTEFELPEPVSEVVDLLAACPGTVAVSLGGSRGCGEADESSDWDLGVYYRGTVDLRVLERLGVVHAPGSWGRIMNGGAWLRVAGLKVDVLLRDLDFVETCSERAERGEYDVDGLLGYVAGLPTYSLRAERELGVLLRGELPEIKGFPERLAEVAPGRWRFHRDFSLEYARAHARRGDVVAVLGQAARAVLEEAHARVCARHEWVLNEKRLVARAGLDSTNDWITRAPREPAPLERWLAEGAQTLST